MDAKDLQNPFWDIQDTMMYNVLVLVPAVSSVSGGKRSEIYHTAGTVCWFSMHIRALFEWHIVLMCYTHAHTRPIRVLSTLMPVESLYVVMTEMFQNYPKLLKAAGVGGSPKEKARSSLVLMSSTADCCHAFSSESFRRSCTLGWFVECVLFKVRKGTGYVALSDLPDDEETASSGTVCCSISIYLVI